MALQKTLFDEGCQIDRLALNQGQRPWAALISCADARLAPEWIFAAGSGELFQLRVAGNSAFDDGIASLELAVAVLEVPLILVLGHSGCGAVKAAMGSAPLTPLLEDLVKPIRSSLQSGDDLTQAIEDGNARHAASQLTKRSAVAQSDGQPRQRSGCRLSVSSEMSRQSGRRQVGRRGQILTPPNRLKREKSLSSRQQIVPGLHKENRGPNSSSAEPSRAEPSASTKMTISTHFIIYCVGRHPTG